MFSHKLSRDPFFVALLSSHPPSPRRWCAVFPPCSRPAQEEEWAGKETCPSAGWREEGRRGSAEETCRRTTSGRWRPWTLGSSLRPSSPPLSWAKERREMFVVARGSGREREPGKGIFCFHYVVFLDGCGRGEVDEGRVQP